MHSGWSLCGSSALSDTNDSETSSHHPLRRRVSCTDTEKINDDVVEVICGTLRGNMHTRLFTCPGIHQPCIELANGAMVSPKQFTIHADKDKQKDWKGSIRVGRRSLRVLIEMGILDFHDHANQCSSKCQSRNYINNNKFPLLRDEFMDMGDMNAAGSYQQNLFATGYPGPMPSQMMLDPAAAVCSQQAGIPMDQSGVQQMATCPLPATTYPSQHHPQQPMMSAEQPQNPATGAPNMVEARQSLRALMHMDPVIFWGEVQRAELLDGVFGHLQRYLSSMRTASHNGLTPNVALLLSRLITATNRQHVAATTLHEVLSGNRKGRGENSNEFEVGQNMEMMVAKDETSDDLIDVVTVDQEPEATALMRLIQEGLCHGMMKNESDVGGQDDERHDMVNGNGAPNQPAAHDTTSSEHAADAMAKPHV